MHDTNDILKSLSSYLFWDVDQSTLDVERSAAYIIERVLEYGQLEDWRLIKQIYGLENIKNIALNIRSLDDVTLHFLSVYFKIKKENFRCYKYNQLATNFWKS